MMSNKPHLHPHQKKRQASLTTRLLVAILILAVFALVIALEATGHVVFRGRLVLLRGGRWLLMWWSPGVRSWAGSLGSHRARNRHGDGGRSRELQTGGP